MRELSPAPVLHVEDADFDALLFKLALEQAGLPVWLQRVCHGQEAIDYLSGAGLYADRAHFPVPELVLLDLQMPVLDGFDVLAWVQSRRELESLPIYVLSSSDFQADISKAVELGARKYIVKNAAFSDAVRELEKFIRLRSEAALNQQSGGVAA